MILTLPASLASIPSINSDALLNLVITVVIVGLVFWLLSWLVGYVGVPEPFNKVIRVILAVAVVIWLLKVIIGLT